MTDKNHKGLSSQQVTANREKYGVNILTPVAKEPVWKMFLGKFNDPIIKILLIAAAVSLLVSITEGHYAETIGIIFAILLATTISFWFEYDARKKFEILNTVNDDTPVKVMRDGEVVTVPKKDVVFGDIVLLESGDEVPADGKLLDAVSLKVNESTLTGEPVTDKYILNNEGEQNEESTYPPNRVFRGTTVSEGHGTFEVDAVGDDTEYGKVARESKVESEEETPLNKQLNRLSKLIGRIGGALAILIFLILLFKGYFVGGELRQGDWLHIASVLLSYFMVSVAIMVMAVPEGLPMSITLSLAMSMRRMLKSNNLVRKMHACETMGAVTVICTDKTGTLTRNEMRVSEMRRYGEISDEAFYEMIAVNSTAFLDKDDKVIGNPTEGALLLWMEGNGIDYRNLREKINIIDQLTFTTERKYMATLVELPSLEKKVVVIKGAPEIVRAYSRQDGKDEEVNGKLREYQNKAMRTLGFAYAVTDKNECEEALGSKDLEFIAVAAISDPVRDDVPDAVRRCLDAGIKIKIVTGDTPATAREIARQIGLWDDSADNERNEITGVEFEAMSDEELLGRIGDIKIMARARPLDKQRLVRLLQQNEEVVAVTGDGTNDAPALNYAQVGLSMGSGTSVAKEASDITLLDDSFSSIATAVMWGRSVYKNIQRFVMFQITVNLVALAVVFFGTIIGDEMPLTVTQILWVNLIMDTFAAMALASLPPSMDVMKERPRGVHDFIITRSMLKWILGVGIVMIAALLTLLILWGTELDVLHLSIFFTVFVMFHFWNLFNARAFGSYGKVCTALKECKLFYLMLVVIIVGQIVIVTFGGDVFRTVPIPGKIWGIIIGATSIIAVGGYVIRKINKTIPANYK